MASNKIWFVKAAIGNRSTSSRGPMSKAEAEKIYGSLSDGMRKWIDKADGTVLVMNDLEKQWRAGEFE